MEGFKVVGVVRDAMKKIMLFAETTIEVSHNFKDYGIHPLKFADRIDVLQTPKKFTKSQLEFF